jgi:hypothetical protein
MLPLRIAQACLHTKQLSRTGCRPSGSLSISDEKNEMKLPLPGGGKEAYFFVLRDVLAGAVFFGFGVAAAFFRLAGGFCVPRWMSKYSDRPDS